MFFGPNFLNTIQTLSSSNLYQDQLHNVQHLYFRKEHQAGMPTVTPPVCNSNESSGFSHSDILKCLLIRQKEIKISQFVDDTVLYLSDPLSSIPAALNLLEHFGSISGLKINPTKTEVNSIFLVKNLVSRLQESYSFHWIIETSGS